MKKFLLLLLPLLLLSAGCGYSVGPLMHPQIESIAIAPVTNETLSFNASAILRQKLTEAVMSDGSAKLKSQSTADCIIYARITGVDYREVDGGLNDDDDFLPNEWRVTVSVEYSVILPGRVKPLVGPRTITGSADFVLDTDLENSRTNGMKQACFMAARAIVTSLTEAW